MQDKIKEYIGSGILETYILGEASEQEINTLLSLKKEHPEIQFALTELEEDLERLAQLNAINPPPGTWDLIEDSIHELTRRPPQALLIEEAVENRSNKQQDTPNYIDVDSSSNHMRVHKLWRWAFIAVFILGKIFLGFAIYFYLENRQARLEVQELKQSIHRTP
ncbi:hypothetical protein [Pedobacter sp. MW01-1-1]|uniref:hypothetical protein n=1 Tax=Pedobacter sp. MW01-1-1 TaxID=3383027 RepID=UPI003FEDB765